MYILTCLLQINKYNNNRRDLKGVPIPCFRPIFLGYNCPISSLPGHLFPFLHHGSGISPISPLIALLILKQRDRLAVDEIAAHQSYVVKAGLKGLIAGFAITIPASILLQRRSPTYRGLTTSLKVFGLIGLPVPAFAVCAEQASIAFERARWYVQCSLSFTRITQL